MASNMKKKTQRIAELKDNRPKAIARYIRISPYKVRLVLDLIRGKSVNEAVAILKNTPNVAAEPILKTVESAAANGEHNNGLNKEDMFVAEIYATQGPTLKRLNIRARGRVDRILKRTSHITVIMDTIKE
jgi:large subunit ribosomal protein L22